MENKLEQLTQKLRAEGLERGRTEAEAIVSEAQSKAQKIIADAEAKAAKVLSDAQSSAEELTRNTANDVRMASEQTLSALRKTISEMVVTEVVDAKVSAAWQSGEFIEKLVIEAVKSWNPSADSGVNVVVPESAMADIKAVVAKNFSSGVEVTTSGRVRVPFRIAPQSGGYYVSFADGDFQELIKATLRPKVAEFLFQSSK